MIPPLTPPLKPRGEDQIEHAAILGDHHQPVNQIEHAVILSDHHQPVDQTDHAVILSDHRQPVNQTEHAVILSDHRQPVDQIEHAVIFGDHPHVRQPDLVGLDIKKSASLVYEADYLFLRSEAYAPCSASFSGRFAAQA